MSTTSFVSQIRQSVATATPIEQKLSYPTLFLLKLNSNGVQEISSIDYASEASIIREKIESMEVLFTSSCPVAAAYGDIEIDQLILHIPDYNAIKELLSGLGLQGDLSITCSGGKFTPLKIPGLNIINNIPKD